jgi:hypothetical protein
MISKRDCFDMCGAFFGMLAVTGDAGVDADCAFEPVGVGRSGEFDGLVLGAPTL